MDDEAEIFHNSRIRMKNALCFPDDGTEGLSQRTRISFPRKVVPQQPRTYIKENAGPGLRKLVAFLATILIFVYLASLDEPLITVRITRCDNCSACTRKLDKDVCSSSPQQRAGDSTGNSPSPQQRAIDSTGSSSSPQQRAGDSTERSFNKNEASGVINNPSQPIAH